MCNNEIIQVWGTGDITLLQNGEHKGHFSLLQIVNYCTDNVCVCFVLQQRQTDSKTERDLNGKTVSQRNRESETDEHRQRKVLCVRERKTCVLCYMRQTESETERDLDGQTVKSAKDRVRQTNKDKEKYVCEREKGVCVFCVT